jgi:peptidyl-prolyl cis-trans isomerase B (cyclophilin B)
MSKKAKSIMWIIIAIVAIALIGLVVYGFVMYATQEVKNPEVTFEIEGYGSVKVVLYPESAPNTVKNFLALLNSGYYDDKVVYGRDEYGVYFGRDSEGDVEAPKLSTINSDIEEDSDDDYEYEINGEFVVNGDNDNTISHKKYVLSMVRADYTQQVSSLTTQSYNSATSQFMILDTDATELNGLYAAFGEVVEGTEIIDELYSREIATDDDESTGTEYNATTINAFSSFPTITNITVETYGVDYGLPETHEAFDYSSYLYQLLTQYYSNY